MGAFKHVTMDGQTHTAPKLFSVVVVAKADDSTVCCSYTQTQLCMVKTLHALDPIKLNNVSIY